MSDTNKKSMDQSKLESFSDAQLIALIESEIEIYDQETLTRTESILKARGYNIEEENEFDNIEIISPESDLQASESRYRKFYAITNPLTFKDTELKTTGESLSSGMLVPYQREIFRNGYYLLRMKDQYDQYTYTPKLTNSIYLCTIYQVKNFPTTVLLIDFEDYQKYKLKDEVKHNTVYHHDKDKNHSSILLKRDRLYVTVYNYFEKEGKKILQTNKLEFYAKISDNIKLAELTTDSLFYNIQNERKNSTNKIKLSDGRDAILFTDFEPFKELIPFWKSLLFGFTVLLGIGIALIPSIWFATKTGWFIFFAFIAVPIVLFFRIVLATPLELFIEEAKKRL